MHSVEARKKPAPEKPDESERHQQLKEVQKKIDTALAEASLTEEQREAFAKSVQTILGRMTSTALQRVHTNVKEFKFYASPEELTKGVKAKYPGLKVKQGKVIKGMVDKDGTVHLNGAGTLHGRPAPLEEFHGHELAHAIDGTQREFSESAKWQAAWEAEIMDGGLLGPNAATTPTEGWGDFGAMLLSGTPYQEVVQLLPKSAKFWRRKGLL